MGKSAQAGTPPPSFSGWELRINWAALLCLAIFWLVAFNGYPAGSHINSKLILLLTVMAYIYFLFNYASPTFQSRVVLKPNLVMLVFIFTALFASWGHLHQPLWGDQTFHSSFAARYGQLTIFLIEEKSPSIWQYIEHMQASTVVRCVNSLIVVFLAFIFGFLPRLLHRHPWVFAIAMMLALMATRAVLTGREGIFEDVYGAGQALDTFDNDPHPLFRLFPLLVSSAIFGVTDFGFRLATFAAYLVFLIFVYIRLSTHCSSLTAAISTASIGTLPIFWHVAYLVEQSVWAAIAGASIFVYLLTSESMEEIRLVPLTLLVVLATLMRAPAFIAFIPVAVLIIVQLRRKKIDMAEINPLFISAALLAMVVLVAASRGSGATVQAGAISSWIYAGTNNIQAVAAASSIGLFPLFFVGYLLTNLRKERVEIALSALLFLMAATFLYFGPIREVLWGISRYQAEIYLPLIAAGIAAYSIDTSKESNARVQWIPLVPLVLMIVLNFFSIGVMDNRTFKPLEAGDNPAFKSEVEFPMDEAFAFVRSKGLQLNTYYIGSSPGFAPVLRGATAGEYKSMSMLNERHRRDLVVSIGGVNVDPKIEAVIIESYGSYADTINKLHALGWQGRRDFLHHLSGERLTVLTRKAL
jgi:hypothetical protein